MAVCKLCGSTFKSITQTHLRAKHNSSVQLYIYNFPDQKGEFSQLQSLLSGKNFVYQKWRQSLFKRRQAWNKGLTKEDSAGVGNISRTLKLRKIDNFKKWREIAREKGIIKKSYKALVKNSDLAELIGLILGDGNIYNHDRVQRLTIAFNKRYPRIIDRTLSLVVDVFEKQPTIKTRVNQNAVYLWMYEKEISNRLGIPSGAKKNHNLTIPTWIWKDVSLLTSCLVGLYNAEGSYTIHKPSYSYMMQFSNTNKTLLFDVHKALLMLQYNPILRDKCVWLRKKNEAERFSEQIKFKYYRSWK